ncbi:hypothetical protein ACUN0C_14060 [Faunimonas sp. B44]|uniref:hypothetical protein n=1 Tax=Faunimonas sp. B44 TaxID=3461493 RepID=UPI004043E135
MAGTEDKNTSPKNTRDAAPNEPREGAAGSPNPLAEKSRQGDISAAQRADRNKGADRHNDRS